MQTQRRTASLSPYYAVPVTVDGHPALGRIRPETDRIVVSARVRGRWEDVTVTMSRAADAVRGVRPIRF